MPLIYFAAPALWPEYRDLLPGLLAESGIASQIVTEAADPAAVDYIIYAPSSPLQNFTPFTNCKAVLNLWAGVERIVGNEFAGFIDDSHFYAGPNSRVEPQYSSRTGRSCEHQVFQIFTEDVDCFGFGFFSRLAE